MAVQQEALESHPTMQQSRSQESMSLYTNLIATGIFLISFVSPVFSTQLRSVGLFALSGALTNWIAIHMLFEKVPGFYGSGVILLRFAEFKDAIHKLIMQQFFSKPNLKRFFEGQQAQQTLDEQKLQSLSESLDYDLIFAKFIEAVMESSLGNMVQMFGGADLFQQMKPQFCAKMQESVVEMLGQSHIQAKLSEALLGDAQSFDKLSQQIASIVQSRLDELTPFAVKTIIWDMIRRHLGWLVVWGGVFGGLIGLVASLIEVFI